MIALYAIVLDTPAALTGARGEPLRRLRCGAMTLLAGDAPPPISAEAIRAHEAAVRRIAEKCEACLPARFGAAADSDEGLVGAMRERESALLDALRLVRGREQMTLRIRGVAAPSAAAASGAGYLEQRRRALRIPGIDPLRAALEGTVRAERVEPHDEPGLLASVYHLIDRGTAPRYQQIVRDTPLGSLSASVSGPWPAWSFAPEASGS